MIIILGLWRYCHALWLRHSKYENDLFRVHNRSRGRGLLGEPIALKYLIPVVAMYESIGMKPDTHTVALDGRSAHLDSSFSVQRCSSLQSRRAPLHSEMADWLGISKTGRRKLDGVVAIQLRRPISHGRLS